MPNKKSAKAKRRRERGRVCPRRSSSVSARCGAGPAEDPAERPQDRARTCSFRQWLAARRSALLAVARWELWVHNDLPPLYLHLFDEADDMPLLDGTNVAHSTSKGGITDGGGYIPDAIRLRALMCSDINVYHGDIYGVARNDVYLDVDTTDWFSPRLHAVWEYALVFYPERSSPYYSGIGNRPISLDGKIIIDGTSCYNCPSFRMPRRPLLHPNRRAAPVVPAHYLRLLVLSILDRSEHSSYETVSAFLSAAGGDDDAALLRPVAPLLYGNHEAADMRSLISCV